MPSPAAIKYKSLAANASVILKADRSRLGREDVQALYGAAFIAQVAAWNAYVVQLIRCFFQLVANPTIIQFHAMHTLAVRTAESLLDRFSTPNAENARNLIIASTGYDPWPDWQWPARGMNALDTRLRLNEILKVRHSLAHGFAMPAYSWTQAKSGQTRLTMNDLAWTQAFFKTWSLRRTWDSRSMWWRITRWCQVGSLDVGKNSIRTSEIGLFARQLLAGPRPSTPTRGRSSRWRHRRVQRGVAV